MKKMNIFRGLCDTTEYTHIMGTPKREEKEKKEQKEYLNDH